VKVAFHKWFNREAALYKGWYKVDAYDILRRKEVVKVSNRVPRTQENAYE